MDEIKDIQDKYIRSQYSNDFENPLWDAEYQKSITDKEGFWKEQAEDLVWSKKFTKVVENSDEYHYNWYPDGEMNICYNAIDRHVDEGRGDHDALAYDSAYTGVQQTFTYKEMQENVAKLATVLKTKFNI